MCTSELALPSPGKEVGAGVGDGVGVGVGVGVGPGIGVGLGVHGGHVGQVGGGSPGARRVRWTSTCTPLLHGVSVITAVSFAALS
jgi:hypothetical protein